MMQEQIQARLADLKKQFEAGQAQMQELERQQAYLRETMLRISGAIQVLEELLAAAPAASAPPAPAGASEKDGQPETLVAG